MALLIFFIILSALVIVHELGHFLAARAFGIRVDEFGLGYPPRAGKLFKWRGTLFTLNWLPFGGFVKIFGENPNEENLATPDSFQTKNRGAQAVVLAAGVFFNFLFAWVLISLGLVTGLPAPQGFSLPVENPQTVITFVMPGSPADVIGLKSGDIILSLNGMQVSPEAASQAIFEATGVLNLEIKRGDETLSMFVTPAEGVVPNQKAIGVAMGAIGTVKLPIHQAFYEGMKITWNLTVATAKALGGFLAQAVIGRADLSGVTGPVGLVSLVGEAQDFGLGYLLSFTALISLNLSLINLIPLPALDGGRLLFVGIEALSRRRIPAKIFNALNATGFALLILLMIIITIRDVRNIF